MREDISLVISGEAGQGIQTVENILVKILKLSGYHVFAAKEYMSRIRGGVNTTSIRVSSKRVAAYVDRIDILIPLTAERTKHLEKRISPQTAILDKPENNLAAVGTICRLFGVDLEFAKSFIAQYFSAKGEKIVNDNLAAAEKGFLAAKAPLEISRNPSVRDEILLSGAEAIGLGAIAGGCNFIAAYPMTPSTGVFTFLAQHAAEFGIISEQAEDEIAAMNMALGAWYAGARALVNTSGGGYDLMQEGLSLAGMLEVPVVVNLAQRPGPATGLPTRTEQGDLNLALYSGHGEFPRIILTPGSIEEAFELTQRAFNLADKFQMPVFILSDQYLVDSYYNFPSLDLENAKVEKYIVETGADYQRYQLTASGLSPRGIPGFGQGLVVVDSDEHDAAGHITEDLELRRKMVEKRLAKLELAKKDAISPLLIGREDADVLVIGWGSTFPVIKEALEKINYPNISFLHFRQVYPLPAAAAKYLKKAKKRIIIENNAASQFGSLIKLHTGIEMDHKILKYDGLPFSVEEIRREIEEAVK